MPYIARKDREKYDTILDTMDIPSKPGELNYFITRLVMKYFNNRNKFNYQGLNETIGVLECAKLELYRRHVAIYEDEKIAENGEVDW